MRPVHFGALLAPVPRSHSKHPKVSINTSERRTLTRIIYYIVSSLESGTKAPRMNESEREMRGKRNLNSRERPLIPHQVPMPTNSPPPLLMMSKKDTRDFSRPLSPWHCVQIALSLNFIEASSTEERNSNRLEEIRSRSKNAKFTHEITYGINCPLKLSSGE